MVMHDLIHLRRITFGIRGLQTGKLIAETKKMTSSERMPSFNLIPYSCEKLPAPQVITYKIEVEASDFDGNECEKEFRIVVN